MKISNAELIIPRVIAHRGLSSAAPENTLSAFNLAAKQGLRWLEVDVKLSQDGIFLLCHDEDLERTTNGKGKISETPWSKLEKLDAGSWFDKKYQGEPLPQLETVLQFCKKKNLGINLELKPISSNQNGFVDTLTPMILHYISQGVDILVSSFNKQAILDIHQQAAQVPLGFLIEKTDTQTSILKFIEDSQCLSIHLPNTLCTKEIIQIAKQLRKKILVYTVNDKLRAEELFSFGVDAVFSNYSLF